MNISKILNFEFKKTLPKDFGSARIIVTGRADRRVLKRGWNGAAFDLQLVARKLIEPGMTVWDIGSNQGLFAFMAAFKAGPTGHVYALEADPHYADLIHRSSRNLSDAYASVDILSAAISDQNSVLRFSTSRSGHARNKLMDYGTNEGFEIEAVKTVASFCGDRLLDFWGKPDVIKMDVEGAELAALKGCNELLRSVRPIFYIEVSEQNERTVADLFRSYEYEIFHLQGNGQEQPIKTCSFYTIARPKK